MRCCSECRLETIITIFRVYLLQQLWFQFGSAEKNQSDCFSLLSLCFYGYLSFGAIVSKDSIVAFLVFGDNHRATNISISVRPNRKYR